jgi:hypothetical protein
VALVALGAEATRAQSPDLPIFDTHIHYSAADWIEYPPERILGILEKAGIKRALVSSTPDDGTLTLHARDPKRIVPILRPYRTRDDMGHWWQDAAVLAYVQERLQKNRGVHKGIGEFHLFGGQTGTFVIKRITEIAVQENIYLHAHSDELAIIELFTIEPRLRVIWAHAGMSSGPQAVGALLDRYPNLCGPGHPQHTYSRAARLTRAGARCSSATRTASRRDRYLDDALGSAAGLGDGGPDLPELTPRDVLRRSLSRTPSGSFLDPSSAAVVSIWLQV